MRTVITICLTVMMSSSFADTSLTYMDKDEASTMQIKNGVLRSASDSDVMLFDSKSQAMTAVNHENKTYTRIDENTMKQMGGAVSEMQKMIEEQLQGLPPEQQAQMRQMMGGMMPSGMGMEKQPIRSEQTSKKGKAGDWVCKIVDVFKGDTKAYQICVTNYKSLGVSKEDYLVMKDFMTFISSMSEDMPMGDQAFFAAADLGDGMLPVIVEGLSQSTIEESMTLNKVSNDTLDAALFAVPAGYKEQNMMDGFTR